MYIIVDDDDEVAEASEPDLDGSDLSLKAQYDHDNDMDLHLAYPSGSSCSKDLQDLVINAFTWTDDSAMI